MREYEGLTADTRILSRSDALQRAEAWRNMGLRVAFLNGNFDLLDADQIARLRAAKQECDRLVVGVSGNGDSGVVLAALACVDLVMRLEEEGSIIL